MIVLFQLFNFFSQALKIIFERFFFFYVMERLGNVHFKGFTNTTCAFFIVSTSAMVFWEDAVAVAVNAIIFTDRASDKMMKNPNFSYSSQGYRIVSKPDWLVFLETVFKPTI